MIKNGAYLLMVLSVLITVSHSIFAHHHEIEPAFNNGLTEETDHDHDHHHSLSNLH